MRYLVWFVIGVLLSGCSSTSRGDYDMPLESSKSREQQLKVILEQLSENIKANPSNPLNYYKRASWQYNEGNYAEALIDITRAERLNPNSGEILFLKSAILQKSGGENALENALYAEDQEYESPDLFTLIANLYLDKSDFGKAEEYFRKAENVYPYNSGLFNGKGKYYAMQKDTLKAIEFYQKAIITRPGVFDYYNDLIGIYSKARMIDSALHFNEVAIARFPGRKELLYNKGFILEETGMLDSAIVLYRRFLREEPNRFDVYQRMGNIYFRKRNFSSAYISYNKWAEMEPENPLPRLKAARSYIAQYNLPAARYYLEKALEKHPDNTLLKAELNAVNYRIALGVQASSTREADDEFSKERAKEEERIFNRSLQINKIPKRKPALIGRDSTRN